MKSSVTLLNVAVFKLFLVNPLSSPVPITPVHKTNKTPIIHVGHRLLHCSAWRQHQCLSVAMVCGQHKMNVQRGYN